MNVEQTMGEQMEERSFHTGGVTGSIPVAPTTQTQTNTGFSDPDKGVNAGSAEPSDTLTDRYGAGVEPAGWRPIETAPKDGTDVLLYWPTRELGLSDAFANRMIGYWSNSQAAWVWQGRTARSYSFEPTLWQPLPPLPTPGGSDETL